VSGFRDVVVGPPGSSEATTAWLRSPPRWPIVWWAALAGCVGVGGLLLGIGAVHLREAYEYRQSSGEGLQLELVGLAHFVAHALVVVGWLAISRLRAGSSSDGVRHALLAFGAAIGSGLATADVAAFWIGL
jgi:hypothetical protein